MSDIPTAPPASLDEAASAIKELLPDNNTGEITPARLRAAFLIVLATIKYGVDQ